ncbi:MAG: ATP-dependent DNA helicase RecG [Planctomycetota bacterium]
MVTCVILAGKMGTDADRTSGAALTSSVATLKGVGPARAEILAKAGIRTLGDLLSFYPRRYHVIGKTIPIRDVADGGTAVIRGAVTSSTVSRPRGGRRSAIAVVEDDTGSIRTVWFNQAYMAKDLKKGRELTVEGRVRAHRKGLSIGVEFYEFEGEGSLSGKVIPIYSVPDGFPRRTFRAIMLEALRRASGEVPEFFGEEIRSRRGLPRAAELLRMVHDPSDALEAGAGRQGLVYEEFFLFEAALALRRRTMERSRSAPLQVSAVVDARIRALFPFTFTAAQDRAIREIRHDLARQHPMNRLLQGDVGSGKTVVAIWAMLAAVVNRRQAAVMAPTEVLAEQHYAVLRKALAAAHVRVQLFTSAMGAKERAETHRALSSGTIQIAVGTHALLQESVRFRNLAVAVIDEQHKFGVLQRKTLVAKGRAPHALVMTATPIPRTLALTVFGDLSISTLAEMPPGRRPVETRVRAARHRGEAYATVRREVQAGRQAYIVYPVIEDSDLLELVGARRMHEKLSREVFGNLRVALLHGAMKSSEKSAVMESFAAGKTDVLVTTPVIEVGMDVPRATVMVIEHAERFGLAQLHQLRGRVGRGGEQGTCFLIRPAAADTHRLRILESTNDGFRIAEEDMKIRGPGEFFGVRQHGLPDFQLANVIEDWNLLEQAREDAFEWACSNTGFEDACSKAILERLRRFARGGEELIHVG